MTTKTKAFETKDALDLYKKIIYTEGKAGRRMDKKQIEEMSDLAIKQLGYSYAPYSHFHVGAALLAKNGTYYTGWNIENAAYGSTMCAERNAIANMITNGENGICRLIAVDRNGKAIPPCGACREFMVQLMPDHYHSIQIMMDYENKKMVTLGDITPNWWI